MIIPTASSDSQLYIKAITEHYWNICDIDVLYLVKSKISKNEIEEKILNSDIIYVSWWNTLKMMTIWRKLAVDKILLKAYKKWIVLSWVSAWAICWFKYWNSDSRKFTSWSNKFIKVSWLWIIEALVCPHYNSEIHRQEDLKRMMKITPKIVSIALDDCSAIEIIDDKYRILKSTVEAKAHKIHYKNWEFIKQEILQTEEFLPLKELFKK